MRFPLYSAVFLGLVSSSFSFQESEQQQGPRVAVRTPQLLTVLPMGAQPGSITDVELQGEFLDRAERVVFTTADVSAQVKNSSFTKIKLEIGVTPAAETGPRYFRVITPRGASNLLLFRISNWPCILEKEPNDDLLDLPSMHWPVLVSGRLNTPRDVDLFRFRAKAGERVSLHLLAARNWSTADLSLAVVDPNGRAIQQDEGTFVWDPYIRFSCPADGEYVAAVMLTRMPAGGQSRTDLVYQLAIGQVPLLVSVFPLYWRSGDSVRLKIRGDFLDSVHPWTLQNGDLEPGGEHHKGLIAEGSELDLVGRIPAEVGPGSHSLRVQHPSGIVSPVTIMSGTLAPKNDLERNDSVESAQAIELPLTVNGKISEKNDEDFYRFEVDAGEVLVFDVDAEKLGSRLDARITLLDRTGKILTTSDDAKGDGGPLGWDPRLEYTFKERGEYFVKLSSTQRRGGEDYVYALTVRRPVPDFTVALGSERLAVPRGDKAFWNVTVQRQEGFKGEVTVEVSGLTAGLQSKPLHLKGDQSAGKIEIAALAEARLESNAVKILGKGVVEGKERWTTASVPAQRISGSGPGFSHYRSTEGWVSVVEPPLFSLESAASEVFLVRGGTAEFGVKIARQAGFSGNPQFTLENAPDGVQVDKVEVVDEGRIARITMRASDTAVVGRVPEVTIIGTVNTAGAPRSESAPRINVQVD